MNDALYRVLKSLIKKNRIDGLDIKIDVFYALNKITSEQYNELIQLLKSVSTVI